MAERDDRRCQKIEGDEAVFAFFIADQELAETIEPTLGNLNDPSPGFFAWGTSEFGGFFPANFNKRNIAMLLDEA